MQSELNQPEDNVERILFITLSCVGDAVMTTPVLQTLHKKYPHALIDVVADKRSSILFYAMSLSRRHCSTKIKVKCFAVP